MYGLVFKPALFGYPKYTSSTDMPKSFFTLFQQSISFVAFFQMHLAGGKVSCSQRSRVR